MEIYHGKVCATRKRQRAHSVCTNQRCVCTLTEASRSKPIVANKNYNSAQLAVFKAEDFAWLHKALREAYTYPNDVPSFLAQKQEYFTDLAEAGQPVNSMDAVSLIQALFPPKLYQLCWQEYNKDHGRIEDRTVVNLCTFIIEYADQRLQHTAGHLAMAAEELSPSWAPPIAAAAALTTTEPDHVGAFLALYAANPSAANSLLRNAAQPAPVPAQTKYKKAGAPPAAAVVAPPPAGRPRPYCYSCGVPPLVKHHHYSTGCKTPKADHKWDATYLNQMGGKKA